jgi:hypothetical protein
MASIASPNTQAADSKTKGGLNCFIWFLPSDKRFFETQIDGVSAQWRVFQLCEPLLKRGEPNQGDSWLPAKEEEVALPGRAKALHNLQQL